MQKAIASVYVVAYDPHLFSYKLFRKNLQFLIKLIEIFANRW